MTQVQLFPRDSSTIISKEFDECFSLATLQKCRQKSSFMTDASRTLTEIDRHYELHRSHSNIGIIYPPIRTE